MRGVSFEIAPGEAFGLVGESGSGKTLTCRSVLGLLPPTAEVSGHVRLGGRSLLDLSPRELQRVRGSQASMVFQDPMTALNPVLRVGDSVAQVIQSHRRVDRRAARREAVEIMGRVGIRDASRRWRSYPHEFSGGMRQRILIAMALASQPTLLLADEPTTALDVIVQAGILRLIDRLRREESMSLLLVSHDISIVAGMCERVGVMYAGQLVEEGPTAEVLFRPRHPYTRALIESLPETGEGLLSTIPGLAAGAWELPRELRLRSALPARDGRVPRGADPAGAGRSTARVALHPRRPARHDATRRRARCRLTCSCRSTTSGRCTRSGARR